MSRKSNIDRILSEYNGPAAEVVQQALATYNARRTAEQAEEVIQNLQTIEGTIESQVLNYRAIKAALAKQKAVIEKLDKARADYIATGNVDAFNKVRNEVAPAIQVGMSIVRLVLQ